MGLCAARAVTRENAEAEERTGMGVEFRVAGALLAGSSFLRRGASRLI